jgi:NADPH:quinone reductase-like Zn-dependent oxidoreductase
MQAFVVAHYGKDGLRAADVPEPEVGDGDVLVEVSAAGINPPDKMVRNGEFKRLLKYRTPFVLGHDVAGVVTRVGSAVRDFQVMGVDGGACVVRGGGGPARLGRGRYDRAVHLRGEIDAQDACDRGCRGRRCALGGAGG